MNISTSKKLLAVLVSSALLSACNSDNTDGIDDLDPDLFDIVTLDATDATQAAQLDFVSVSTVTDDTWQIAYQKYLGFKLNGGASADGNVSGCVAHEYTDLFDENGDSVVEEFKALTVSTTVTEFDSVDATSCTEFESDTLKTTISIEDWLDADYSQGTPIYSAKADNGWIIRSADGVSYARVKVKTVDVAFLDEGTTRKVTLSSELWNGSSFDSAIDSPILDFSTDRVFWDLETNSIVTESDDWDLSLIVDGQDYPLQVNGGASGAGEAGAGAVIGDLDEVTDPTDTAQVYKYFADTAEGVLSTPGNYGALQYAVDGGHLMWPTFTTYLIKDESESGTYLFKIQLLSNYGEDGTMSSGNLVFRYEELSE